MVHILQYGPDSQHEFHDPVMTDRAFITDPYKMRRAFLLAGILGVLFIFLFSLVGVFSRLEGLAGNAVLMTAAHFGLPLLIFMNVMMLTSASSTLDSTFSSTGKLIAIDLMRHWKVDQVVRARGAMVVLALAGNVMLYATPTILSATTISGTMVIGLTPVFTLAWWKRAGAVSYYASVLLGVLFGLVIALSKFPFAIGAGKYGALLGANLLGISLCCAVYVLAAWLWPAPSPRSVTSVATLHRPLHSVPSANKRDTEEPGEPEEPFGMRR